jgi:hypothetical protein
MIKRYAQFNESKAEEEIIPAKFDTQFKFEDYFEKLLGQFDIVCLEDDDFNPCFWVDGRKPLVTYIKKGKGKGEIVWNEGEAGMTVAELKELAKDLYDSPNDEEE